MAAPYKHSMAILRVRVPRARKSYGKNSEPHHTPINRPRASTDDGEKQRHASVAVEA